MHQATMLPFLLAALAATSTAANPAPVKCVNGFKTYQINFDQSASAFPTAANLSYNNFAISDRNGLCNQGANPAQCTIAAPQTAPNYISTNLLGPFNAASITNLPPNFLQNPHTVPTFALESFYFSCYTFDGNINYVDAPCTLQTVSAPLYAGKTLVTKSFAYAANGTASAGMKKAVLGDTQTNTVYLTLTAGTSLTGILIDSLVVKQAC